MSEELTTVEGPVIYSVMDAGKVYLARNGGPHFLFTMMAHDECVSYDAYCQRLTGLWQERMKGKPAQLLNLTLTDESLVYETIHLLAPGTFYSYGGPLTPAEERLAMWLRSPDTGLGTVLAPELRAELSQSLERILSTHFSRLAEKRGDIPHLRPCNRNSPW